MNHGHRPDSIHAVKNRTKEIMRAPETVPKISQEMLAEMIGTTRSR